MIKKLKNKFFICLFLLVTLFSVASSCFAIEQDYVEIASLSDYGLTYDDFYSRLESYASTNYNLEEYNALTFVYRFDDLIYFVVYKYNDTDLVSKITLSKYDYLYAFPYDVNGNSVSSYSKLAVTYNITSGSFSCSNGSSSNNKLFTALTSVSCVLFDDTSCPVYYVSSSVAETLIYEPSTVDLSFDYSIEGVKRGQTKLKINNLDTSLRMYGYVGCENNFNIGDTLDTSSISSYLRLLAMYSDNSDLDCYLYDGEELLYYILDENNVILDIGYISEMAKGNFLYGFNVYNGVDFVFLKDGQVYWDNNLTFKYSVGSSSVYEKNDIVSMGQSSYIVTDKTVAFNIYKGYVYDIDGTLIAEASANSSNDLSSISISVDTNYYETNVGWNKSCYWLMSFDLDGTNVDGSFIDFSNYYAKWSIPTWINLDSIEVSEEEYTKRNGIISGFSSAGYSGMINLKIFELIKNHISNFDIKLEIYDSEDNLVLTHLINSDDIVKNQVAKEENNVDKGDYDILDNPNYTGGSSSSPNIDNIEDWTADDYLNLMSTDNFVWEFFKAILGNLPWWITTPLTILIFGVVIITLIRFARGA